MPGCAGAGTGVALGGATTGVGGGATGGTDDAPSGAGAGSLVGGGGASSDDAGCACVGAAHIHHTNAIAPSLRIPLTVTAPRGGTRYQDVAIHCVSMAL